MGDISMQDLKEIDGRGILITGTKYLSGKDGEGGFGSDKQWGWIKRFDFYESASDSDQKRELYFLGYQENNELVLKEMVKLGVEADLANTELGKLSEGKRQEIETKINSVADRQIKISPSQRSLLADEIDLAPYNVLVGQRLLQKVFSGSA